MYSLPIGLIYVLCIVLVVFDYYFGLCVLCVMRVCSNWRFIVVFVMFIVVVVEIVGELYFL